MLLSLILKLVFGLCSVAAAIIWCLGVVYSIVLLFHTKPGAATGWFRFNSVLIFFPEKLTPRGLVIRKWLLRAFPIFWALVLAAYTAFKLAEGLGQ